MTPAHIETVLETYAAMDPSDISVVLPNKSFGYWKIVVERPLRLASRFTHDAVEGLRFQSGHRPLREALYIEFGDALFDDFASIAERLKAHLDPPEPEAEEVEEGEEEVAEPTETTSRVPKKTIKKLLDQATWARDRRLHRAAQALIKAVGNDEYNDYSVFEAKVETAVKEAQLLLTPAETRLIARAMSWRSPAARPIVKSTHKPSVKHADPRGGLFPITHKGNTVVVAYEPDKALSDTEIVAFDEAGGIEAFFEREVAPHADDAWIDRKATKIGYEISFARHFYKPTPPRPLAEIRTEIDALERQTLVLLDAVLVEADA